MTLNIYEVPSQLPSVIQRILNGEEVNISQNGVDVAKLVPMTPKLTNDNPGRVLGVQRGSMLYMAADFDKPIEDIKEYM